MERYYLFIDYKEELISILNRAGVTRKNQVSNAVIDDVCRTLGNDISKQKEINCHKEVAK